MELHFNSYGSESLLPLIILHGLLGSSDNWHSFGQRFGEHFHTFTLDARNHGRSPHDDQFDYQVMAEDVVEFMTHHSISSASPMGHSMGGKTAALTALLYPELVDKLIVVDISTGAYPAHHDQVMDALTSLDIRSFEYRKDIDRALAMKISDTSVRQFLMKNLSRDSSGGFRWKMDLEIIEKNYARINEELPRDKQFSKPTLFIRGSESDYIKMEDMPLIGQLFPKAEFVTIRGAGHWVHTEAPEEFFYHVIEFLGIH